MIVVLEVMFNTGDTRLVTEVLTYKLAPAITAVCNALDPIVVLP